MDRNPVQEILKMLATKASSEAESISIATFYGQYFQIITIRDKNI